jgi:hypothetical protein
MHTKSYSVRSHEEEASCKSPLLVVPQFDQGKPALVVTTSLNPPQLLGDVVFSIVERLAVARLERAAERMRGERG